MPRARSRRALSASGAGEPLDEGWRPLDVARDDPESPTPGVDQGRTYPADATVLYDWRPTYWRRRP